MALIKYFSGSGKRITLGLTILKVIRVVFSLMILRLSAKYFGVSSSRDSWILAGGAVTVITQVLFGPINDIFRTKFIHLNDERGQKVAFNGTRTLLWVITTVCLLISLIFVLFPEVIANIFAPGFKGVRLNDLLLMIKVIGPTLIFLELTTIYSGLMNSFSSFYLPEFFTILSTVLNLLAIVLLAKPLGIYSLILSQYLSLILLLLACIYKLKTQHSFNVFIGGANFQIVGLYIVFALPLYLNYILSQGDFAIEKIVLSNLQAGGLSILDYARRFIDLPLSMLISVVTAVVTPILAIKSSEKIGGSAVEMMNYLRTFSLIVVPVCILLIIQSSNIIHIFFSRDLQAADRSKIACALSWYALGMFFAVLNIISSQVLIVEKKIKKYTIIQIVAFSVKIVFNLIFYKNLGIFTFPISWMIFQCILAISVISVLAREGNLYLRIESSRILGLFALSFSICYFITKLIHFKDGLVQGYFSVAFSGTIIVFVVISLMYLLKFEERQIFKQYISKWLK